MAMVGPGSGSGSGSGEPLFSPYEQGSRISLLWYVFHSYFRLIVYYDVM